MDIPVLMTVNDSWTSSCLSATQDSNHKMMDYKQSQKHNIVLTEKMGQLQPERTSLFKGHGNNIHHFSSLSEDPVKRPKPTLT